MDFDRLDAILKERKMSRRKLGLSIGINEHAISTAFKRKSGLDKYLIPIASFLEVDPSFLAGIDKKTVLAQLDPELGELIRMYDKWTPYQRTTIMNQLRLLDKLINGNGGAE